MAIDHEAHKIRIKAVSDRMNHPMTYNDAGAPKENFVADSMSNPKANEAMHKKALKDKMNRAPEFNKGLKKRGRSIGI